MSELFGELLQKRKIAESFLHPKYEELANPLILPDMEKAVGRLKKAVAGAEKVLIYGDYDVDGVTASVVMHDTLKLIGIKELEIMLPDRFKDGYGMSNRVVERAKNGGFTLVVTVDCGSRNHEIIEELAKNGVDTIVTDHHECPELLPKAVAVVNPKRTGVEKSQSAEVFSEKGLVDLAGVGVAFELARALMLKKMLPEGQEKWLLDLVLIGTICDAMKISQENRILTYWGVKVLEKTRRIGLKELMRVSKVEKITAETIGFRLGPRLNAAGRLESAKLAMSLLLTKDSSEAAKLAAKLEELNNKRRDLQMRALQEINTKGVPEGAVVVATGEWPEGVLGIIAGKLVEKYEKPAFVLSLVDGVWKGSGRSFGEFNLAKALKECQDCILGGGGHAEACGLKIASEGVEVFREKVNNYYESLQLKDQDAFLRPKEDICTSALAGFSLEFMEDLAILEPFGEGNREPLFKVEGLKILELARIGAEGQHLSMLLEAGDGAKIRSLAWNAPETWMRCEQGQRVSILMRPMVDEFRGLKKVEAEVLALETEDSMI